MTFICLIDNCDMLPVTQISQFTHLIVIMPVSSLCLNNRILITKHSNPSTDLRGWSCTWMEGCCLRIAFCGQKPSRSESRSHDMFHVHGTSFYYSRSVIIRCDTGRFIEQLRTFTQLTCWLGGLAVRLWRQSYFGPSSGWQGPIGWWQETECTR